MKIKKCLALFICATLGFTVFSQSKPTTLHKDSIFSPDIEMPIMYQFDPNYQSNKTNRRKLLIAKIQALDTLPISVKRRQKLIKALYKDLNSEKFNKIILANTKYEEEDMK